MVVNIRCLSVWHLYTVKPRIPLSGEDRLGLALCVWAQQASFASFLTARQLVEQVLVQCFILALGAGGQENVATDVFVHHLAICTQARERNGDVLVKLDRHLEEKAQGNLTSNTERWGRSCFAGDGPRAEDY